MVKTLQELIGALDFSTEGLEMAAEDQPMLFQAVAKKYVITMSKHLAAKAKLSEKKTELALNVRKKASELAASGQKFKAPTEVYIEQLVENQSPVKVLTAELHKAEAQEEYLHLLLEAYKMRRDSIRALVELRRADLGEQALKVHGETTAQSAAEAIVKDLKQKYPG